MGPDGIARELARIIASTDANRQPVLPHLDMPAHHDVRAGDIVAKRLYGNLAAAADRGPTDFPDLLLGNLCKSQLQLQYNVCRSGLLHWVGG